MRWSLTLDEPPAAAAAGDTEPEGGCPDGQVWDPDLGECVDQAADSAPADGAAPAAVDGETFHTLMTVTSTMSGDGRWINDGALTWLDGPLILMGQDSTMPEHMEAIVMGSITRVAMQGREMHGWGRWATGPEVSRIRTLVREKHLTGVSVDMDDVQFEIVFPESEGDDGLILLAAAGDHDAPEGESIPMDMPQMVVTAARVVGATIVPFPAFQEAFIEDLAPDEPLDAQPAPADDAGSLTAAAVPVNPPRSWFADLDLPEGTPLTFTDAGEIFGHAAEWSSCHLSFPDRCVPPPRSASGYAYFHTGEVVTAEGDRVSVGHIALRGGHADLNMSAAQAQQHYDDTRSCIADVRVGEDKHGVWVHGALRPGVTPAEVRTAMASGVSGDWRHIGAGMELIHLASVNVPGFNGGKARTRVRESLGLVAAVQAVLAPVERRTDDALLASAVERIARSIGRGTDDRRAALYARVHPDRVLEGSH